MVIDETVVMLCKGAYIMKKNKLLRGLALTLAISSLGLLIPNTLLTKVNASDKSASTTVGNDSDKSESATVTDSSDKARIKSGWHKADNGTWNYYDATGTMVTKKWIQVNGLWHYLDVNGVRVTGWYNVDGKWYYLSSSGARTTGWNSIGGDWYHFDESGVMSTGWHNDNGKWYYLSGTGKMLSNTVIQGRYVLNKSGVWIK